MYAFTSLAVNIIVSEIPDPGRHTHFKGVHTYQCRHVSIHAERALPVHTDGEPVFLQKSISASCDSKMLQVIVPQRR